MSKFNIGDKVKVDNFEGRITDIKARYTVIRALSGRESIVPNEMLITSRVENLSLADPKVAQTTQVAVAYNSPVDEVVQLLEQACMAQSRVLAEPAPAACLANFGADLEKLGLGSNQIRVDSDCIEQVLIAFDVRV